MAGPRRSANRSCAICSPGYISYALPGCTATGPRNFVKTMIRLARDRDELRVVTDETGSPTYAGDVAESLDKLVRTDAYGIYHLPNSGTCSRYEWAAAILEQAGPHRAELVPTTNYPRAARVPKHASLRNACGEAIGITLRPWQEALAGYMRGYGP